MKSVIAILLLIFATATVMAQDRSAAPDFAVVQYAGSIGYLSGGLGYDLFQNRGRASVHFGSVPRSEGGPLNILSGKIIGEPWTIAITEKITINPLDVGLMLSYHMGENFKTNVPDLLAERNYYWWHTNLRVHLITETSISVEMEPNRFFRKFTAYIELNSNDLYMVSYFANASTLKPHELIKAGVGIRLNF
jgi:hypothetical protein